MKRILIIFVLVLMLFHMASCEILLASVDDEALDSMVGELQEELQKELEAVGEEIKDEIKDEIKKEVDGFKEQVGDQITEKKNSFSSFLESMLKSMQQLWKQDDKPEEADPFENDQSEEYKLIRSRLIKEEIQDKHHDLVNEYALGFLQIDTIEYFRRN